MYTLSDFDFNLPDELIAQSALPIRSASRLLEVGQNNLIDRCFTELPSCLKPGDLLVFNDTKVLDARFFGQKASGGRVEVLIERVTEPRKAIAQIRSSKRLRQGSQIRLSEAFDVTVGERVEAFYTLHFPEDCLTLIERYGSLPLPPYIQHDPEAIDKERYQTVYASNPGAVAAPTAGLHFDEKLLSQLDARGIRTTFLTLHVGSGTFTPVRCENLAEHTLHSEHYHLLPSTIQAIEQTRLEKGRIIAVGTTSLRALEAAALSAHRAGYPLGTLLPGSAETNLFLKPGDKFHIVDRLITNFHLPKSTLLMLVCAFAGMNEIRLAYRHAIEKRYRFFSYGDAMLLTRTS